MQVPPHAAIYAKSNFTAEGASSVVGQHWPADVIVRVIERSTETERPRVGSLMIHNRLVRTSQTFDYVEYFNY